MNAGQRPLAGRTIVVTRPRAQAGALADLIAAEGGQALIFPLLEIAPALDPAPLDAALAAIADYHYAVFISPNAVAASVPQLLRQQAWPSGLQPVAVGGGTVAALAELGVHGTLAPTAQFDSEALLALPELQAEQVAGRRVVLFRGDGGRELLADTLRQRGATVDYVACYRRLAPLDAEPLRALWQVDRLDAITISSSEGLRNLHQLLAPAEQERLRATPTFVPHARIVAQAEALGHRRVIATAAADAGILAGLCAYNWRLA